MDHRDMASLARSTAAELSAQRGETWTATPDADPEATHPGAQLTGPDGARLQLRYDWDAPGKITITGLHPGGGLLTDYRANIDPARGPAVIAREITRRILDAAGYGYLAALPGLRHRHAERAAAEADRLALLTQAAAITGQPAPASPGDRVTLGHLVPGFGDVRAAWTPGHMSIELTDIPGPVMLRMLAVLADPDREITCSCCTANQCECGGTQLDAPAPITTHTGMLAHDGWAPHSHEVRPDHNAVPPQPF